MSQEVRGTRRFTNALRDPILNGLGLLVGVIGLLLAGYTYLTQGVEPNLVALISQVRTIVVSASSVDNLQVLADGKPVRGPVTAVQVAVWNDGRMPIRSEDVLEPLQIALERGAPIISVRTLQVTRSVTQFEIDDSRRALGVLGLRFRILEKGDGALLQITYLGGQELALSGQGAIVGQSKFLVAEVATSKTAKAQAIKLTKSPGWKTTVGRVVLLALVVALAIVVFLAFRNELRQMRERWQAKPRRWAPIIMPIVVFSFFEGISVFLGVAVAMLLVADIFYSVSPPFPFT